MKKLIVIVSTIALVSMIVWFSPLRSKVKYLGYRMGILVIDSCVDVGYGDQGEMFCIYKFDAQALWGKFTNPKKLPLNNLPEN